MRIALTGKPNSGKTTMYNAITGRNERVGNWAGVTVEKKETEIDTAALSARLDCPVAKTVSTTASHAGLVEAVKTAAAQKGKGQKAPYHQGDIDLANKAAVEAADRKRFEFVNKIVAEVETRKVLTKDKNFQDKIDAVLTHPVLGIGIFAVVMFLVFQISQAWVGSWIAEGYEFENGTVIPGLVTLIDAFKEWACPINLSSLSSSASAAPSPASWPAVPSAMSASAAPQPC